MRKFPYYMILEYFCRKFLTRSTMQEKKFYREEYPLDILEEYGLTEEMIYDLPDFVHETLEMGGKSPLLPIKVQLPYGHAHAFAKFRLTETEEGIDVLFSPKLNSADLSQFSEKEQAFLNEGRVIVAEVNDTIITDEGVEDTRLIKAFVQLDRDTLGVVYCPTPFIGRNLNSTANEYDLTGDQLKSFWKGELVTLQEENEYGEMEDVTIGIDLFDDKGVVIVPGDADKYLNTVRHPMPMYNFGTDGCWVNRNGHLQYVPEAEFTNDIQKELERLSHRSTIIQTQNSEQEREAERTDLNQSQDDSHQLSR